ncbi:MAG: hypothetical protein LBH69_00145 [Methanomassiliicoccaceae archaeon]|jgi:hypothetical protein|nr:hypothetical protein [Methanomassiliicoccaceae archaeon]
MGIGQEVLNVPMGEMVYKLSSAIAESQFKLDLGSVDILRIMGDRKNCPVFLPIVNEDGTEGEIETSMVGAGFQPAFYQFSDAIIEVKMAISMGYESEYSSSYESKYQYGSEYKDKGKNWDYKSTYARTTTMNATYTNKYSFSEDASSTLRVRLVPLPPNPIMQRLIDLRAQRQQLIFESQMKKAEKELEKAIDKAQTTCPYAVPARE